MATDALYHEVAEVLRCVLAKEKSVRNAVYGSSYKVFGFFNVEIDIFINYLLIFAFFLLFFSIFFVFPRFSCKNSKTSW